MVAPRRSHVHGGTFEVGGRVTIKMAVVLSPKKGPISATQNVFYIISFVIEI